MARVKTDIISDDKYGKHLSLEQREIIISMVKDNCKLNDIAAAVQKDSTTVSKELKNNRLFRPRNNYGRSMCNICLNSRDCIITPKKANCISFKEEICPTLTGYPWVCNACNKSNCKYNQFRYSADVSQKNHATKMSESRMGLRCSESEFKILDEIISTGIKKGQSINHIVHNNQDQIQYTSRMIYNFMEKNKLSAKNIDLPRKVSYKPRRTTKMNRVDIKKARNGRVYTDFLAVPNKSNVVQIDLVEGAQNNGLLLTIHFTSLHFMLAFKVKNKTPEEIWSVFDYIQSLIGIEEFKRIFPIILTDRGSEFFKPELLEFDQDTGEKRTSLYYCDAHASWQKGAIEKNHEYIRYILPKGTTFGWFEQDKVELMMSHINSASRASINNATPHELAQLCLGADFLEKMKIKKILPNDVILKHQLLK